MTRPEHEMLEDLFAKARAEEPRPPQSLMDRIEAEGRARQPGAARRGWQEWLAGIGGPLGLGGMVTATVAGIWIGAAGPSPLAEPVEDLLGFSALDEAEGLLDPAGFGWDTDEGAAG